MHQVCHLGQNFEIRELNLYLEGRISAGYLTIPTFFDYFSISIGVFINTQVKFECKNVCYKCFFYICRCESLNLVKSSTPPHSIFLSLLLVVTFLFPSSTKRNSFSDLVNTGLRRLVVGFPVDDESSDLFRNGFQSLDAIPKTKVLGHFHEWLVALVPINRHEVSDRRAQQLKTTPIKSFPLKVKESRSFETESLVFPFMPRKSYVFGSIVTALVSFKGAIGKLSDQVGYVKGSLGVLEANDLEGRYQV